MAKTAQREAAHQAATTTAPSAPVVIEQQVEKKKRGRKKGSGNGGAAAAAQQRKANIINERDYVPNRPTRQQSADLRRKRTQLNVSIYYCGNCTNPRILQCRTEIAEAERNFASLRHGFSSFFVDFLQ